MSLIAKATASVDPIPAGMHHAICYAIADIGTQPAFGNFPPKRKVIFVFEIPGERGQFERDGKLMDLPRAISTQFSLTLNKKGNLLPALVNWRGREFTSEELAGFNVMLCIGANALLNITHKAGTGKNVGRVFSEITSINPLPKGSKKLQPENPLMQFSLDDFPAGTPIVRPPTMPDWIWLRVMQSDEYIKHEQHKPTGAPEPTEDEMANLKPGDAADEDVPF